VQGLTITNSTFNYEKPDNRYVIFLDDVIDAKINGIKAMKAKDNSSVIKLRNSSNIKVENAIYYPDEWGKSPVNLEVVRGN
jgi:hypothetical protein